MRIFHCDHCQHLIYFENFQCVRCGHVLAYLPDLAMMGSLAPDSQGRWTANAADAHGRMYRLCQNYERENVCNWAVPTEDPHTLCVACRLNHTIPDLRVRGNREAWYALEVAKRRLVYSLLALGLPVIPKSEDPQRGLAFRFLADASRPTFQASPILTGHADGVITINLAEANDAEREQRRLAMNEPYRTLLGHLRHEIGHFYWSQFVSPTLWLHEFRELFGDERQDYARALERHYWQGPPAAWQVNYISAYASVHPWEDWAETWAHYLHITDTLETASDFRLVIRLPGVRPPHAPSQLTPRGVEPTSFEEMMSHWFTMTFLLNNLSRGLGQKDIYPFVLSARAVEKLRFVHCVCQNQIEKPHSAGVCHATCGDIV